MREIADWQRAKLREWQAGGKLDSSPILWAALSTYLAAAREIEIDENARDAASQPWREDDAALSRSVGSRK